MPLPPPLVVKSPRSDVTVGLRNSTVVNLKALVKAEDFGEIQAKDFLQDPKASLLRSHATTPPLIIEGNSYSAGKSVFEAQSQAAVSGDCMITMQLTLATLVKRISSFTNLNPVLQSPSMDNDLPSN
jgi:hypothetical protein